MADPLTQALLWTVSVIQQFAFPIALGVGGYWAFLLYRRTRSSDDPSYRKFSSNALGSMSFVVSGAYFSAALAGVLALVTWPLPMNSPAFGLLLVGGVVFHAVLEKQEDMEATS